MQLATSGSNLAVFGKRLARRPNQQNVSRRLAEIARPTVLETISVALPVVRHTGHNVSRLRVPPNQMLLSIKLRFGAHGDMADRNSQAVASDAPGAKSGTSFMQDYRSSRRLEGSGVQLVRYCILLESPKTQILCAKQFGRQETNQIETDPGSTLGDGSSRPPPDKPP